MDLGWNGFNPLIIISYSYIEYITTKFRYIFIVMDEHSHFNKMNNGPTHTKTYTPSAHLQNAANYPSYSQPRMSHNSAISNSNKDLNVNKEQQKPFKPPNFHPSINTQQNNNYIGGSGKIQLSSSGSINTAKINAGNSTTGSIGSSPQTPKMYPSFLQNRNQMKGSLFMGQAQSSIKNPKTDFHTSGGDGSQHYKRPRMSEQPDMKFSATDFQNHKVPSFLQQKTQKKQKKVPYQNDLERPESSKQAVYKSSFPGDSLSSSYGSMKKSRMDQDGISQQIDPASEWVKRSWNKKKEKKLSINDFEQIKDLGSGKYGQVYLAREKKTHFVCALKIIEKKLLKQQQITEQFIRELKIQSFLNHPNIIRMYGFFDDHVNIYIILEVGTGGQLFKQLKKHQSMPQPKVAGLMRQVCQAINELHSHHIIHRDIKPQNIVLSQGVVKLCDFGWSVYSSQTLRNTFCGTPLYVGPEILRGKQYNQKIDIWSLGVMMYEMLIGQNPFKITKQQQLIKIVKDQIKIPSYVQISQEGKDFLFCCLQKNPDDRLSIRQLLNHEFFKKFPDKADKKMPL